jgi:signal transduction histidine kinase/CheY-like chemotaxis protein
MNRSPSPLRFWGLYALATVATVGVTVLAWHSGGIYSSELNWLFVVPVLPFYLLGRRHGNVWLAVVLCVLAGLTWLPGWLGVPQPVQASSLLSSFITDTLALLVLSLVPWRDHERYQRAIQRRNLRTRELQKKRDELQLTLKARQQFITLVSHELRTPMNAILGFSHLLLERVQDGKAREILRHTRRSADHLLTVINDVFDHAQVQHGQLQTHLETCALRRVVHDAFDLLAYRAQGQGLAYHCDIDTNVPEWVQTDPHRLVQVLVNLLGNALKFTAHGFVHLRVSWQNGGVRFEVKDTGIGIAHDQLMHIFAPYAQADDEVQARFGGTGLGLSISAHIVQLLQGQIGVSSDLGKGSRFWFWLPLTPVPRPSDTTTPSDAATPTSSLVRRFLVVDDHPINRMLACAILQMAWENCVIVQATNGREALDQLAQHSFDLVLMDLVMPEMDGIEALQHLRALPAPICHIPVLGLTANINPKDLARFRAAGVDAITLKPFEHQQVIAQIQTLLSSRRR